MDKLDLRNSSAREKLREMWRDADIPPYTYPTDSDGVELDLSPKSDTGIHNELVTRIVSIAQEGWDRGSVRHAKFTEMEQCQTSFKWTDEEEKKIVAADARKPVSMVVPVSKAILDTMVSYYCKALLESPMLRFDGSGPEDAAGAILLEKIIEMQAAKFGWWLSLRTMIRDALLYGCGTVSPQWVTNMVHVKQRIPASQPSGIMGRLLGAVGLPQYIEQEADIIASEGHRLFNIEQRKWIPDPNVSADRVQDSEYQFWLQRKNYMDLLTAEQYGGGTLFNVKFVRRSLPALASYFETTTGRTTVSGIDENDHGLYTKPVDLITGYVKLIPVEWKLGSSEYPEVWQFTVAGGEILVGASRVGSKHGKIPVINCAPDYDGYTSRPISAVETTMPLQKAADFFLSTMVTMQRKQAKGVNILNPIMVDLRTTQNPEIGGYITLHPDFYYQAGAVRDAMYPVPFVNETGNNLAYVGFCADMMKMATGASDQMQGMPRQNGERVTAQEIQSVQQGAFSRMEMGVTVAAHMAMMTLGEIVGSNTVQYMKKSTWVKMLGTRMEQLRSEFGNRIYNGYVEVDPTRLDCNYDVLPRAHTIPGGMNVNALVQAIQMIAQSPQGQQIDMRKVFERVARETGAGNVDDLMLPTPPQVTIVPDQQIPQMVQSGQIAPMEGM